MFRIGLPNRSSLLHIAGIVQAIKLGMLDQNEYHPAKLYYSNSKFELVLSRALNLCEMLNDESLDGIFTGGDYAQEFLSSEFDSLRVPIFETYFALLGGISDRRYSSINTIFTKFPRAAEQACKRWNISFDNLREVDGGTEVYVSLGKGLAFDVVCTGISVAKNCLKVLHKSAPITPAWYFGTRVKPHFQNDFVPHIDALVPGLRNYSSNVLATRDDSTSMNVDHLLSLHG